MNREELISKLIEKSNVAPIYISEITNIYPQGSSDYDFVTSTLEGKDVDVIDDSKELDAEFIKEAESIDTSNIDLSNLPFKGNLVDLYLRDIAPYPVLTQDDEIKLFKLVEEGKVAENKLGLHLAGISELTDEDYEKETLIAQNAEKARAKIINCNLRLVVHNAKNYNNRGLNFLDLVQEGSMGLMVAVNKFDYERGFKFSTYATAWIKQAISRALDLYSRTIRVPSHIIEKNNKIIDATRKLSIELGCDPTDEDIAKKVNMSVEKVREIKQAIIKPISLEKTVGADEDTSIGDFVQDVNGLNPFEYTKKEDLKETFRKCFKSLSEREVSVLVLRYGLNGEKPLTLEEVGKRFDLTRERIRQIESRALKKLREPKNLELLKDFMKDE